MGLKSEKAVLKAKIAELQAQLKKVENKLAPAVSKKVKKGE